MSEARTIPAKYVFLNVVGFTRNRSVEAQADIIRVLNDIVESIVREYGILKEDVLFIPTGDGIGVALLNIESPYDIHLLVALGIVRETRRYSVVAQNEMRRFQVRVGVSASTDSLITDINGNQNIVGAGVSDAARLMNLADGNQILVGDMVFDSLRRHEKYIKSFQTFRAENRHGAHSRVYQFVAEGFEGLNVAPPSALTPSAPKEPETQPITQPSVTRELYQTTNRETNAPEIKTQSAPNAPVVVSVPSSPPAAKKPSTTHVLHPAAATKTSAPRQSPSLETPNVTPTTRESKPEWIKTKTVPEAFGFLESAAPPKTNRALLWMAGVLVLGAAGFGAWTMANRQPDAVQPATNRIADAPTATPAPTAALLANANSTPAIIRSDTAIKQGSAPKTVVESKPKKSQSEAAARPTATVAVSTPRPIIRQAIAQSSAAPQQQRQQESKKQPVKSNQSKPSKKVTIDDLIN